MFAAKTILTGATAILFLLLVAGTAAAQEPVVIRAWPTIDDPSDGGEVEVPPEGRGSAVDFPTQVHLQVMGQYACAQAVEITVEVLPPPQFPPWAGMSIVPQPATYVFEVGGNGPSDVFTETGPTFNTAWDMDSAPVNTTVSYTLAVEIDSIEGSDGNPEACIPLISSGQQQEGSTMINLTRPWTPPPEGGSEVDCTIEPEHPDCRDVSGPEEGGDSPGLGAIIVIGALAAAAIAARRRQ